MLDRICDLLGFLEHENGVLWCFIVPFKKIFKLIYFHFYLAQEIFFLSFFFFFVCFVCMARGILVPQPGIKSVSLAVEAES